MVGYIFTDDVNGELLYRFTIAYGGTEWVEGWFKRSKKFLQDFLTGATRFEPGQSVCQEKLGRSDLMTLIVFGNLLGVLVFHSYYAWRLFPISSP
jgi:hypothetical protein